MLPKLTDDVTERGARLLRLAETHAEVRGLLRGKVGKEVGRIDRLVTATTPKPSPQAAANQPIFTGSSLT
jgi:hypothetical protein